MPDLKQFDRYLTDDGVAALVIREYLMPVEGIDGIVFPSTFAEGNGFPGGYNIDGEGEKSVCLIDTVGSQANRIEPIFANPPFDALVPQIIVKAGEKEVNLLDAGHRAGDALVRCSELQDELRKAFVAVLKGDATIMAKIAPTSLVFGVWDSRDTQAKLPRLLASTIRAFGVQRLTRGAQYNPPLNYAECDVFSEEDKAKAEGDNKNPLAKRGFVHVPATGSHGGVIAREVRRDATLGLAALRLLHVGKDKDATLALRRYILGLALTAFTQPGGGYLRQGCLAQGLLLREAGYRCDHGVLYFAGSRTRVDVPFTPDLEALTRQLIEQAKLAAGRCDLPPPLDDSPKCTGCSLNGICLPDETLTLQSIPADAAATHVRRLYPAHEDALPFYIQQQGATLGKRSEQLIVSLKGEELARKPLKDVSQVVLCGNIIITAQTVHLLCEAGVPIVHLSMGHWFYGITHGTQLRNAYDRAAQFQAAAQPPRCLDFARELVAAKGANQRTLLRRNGEPPAHVLADMSEIIERISQVQSIESLLGTEGQLAALYFRHFASMLRPRDFSSDWDFTTRNRRPPRDPVNALLSFGYALLVKECTTALLAEGLDPWWGFYHQPRHGRPALALDIMEPFRPVVVNSVVITAINTGMVQAASFTVAATGCMLKDTGRKAFIQAYEARLDQLVTHPVFDYRCSWRSMIRLHARLLSRWLRGDVPRYESITTR